MASTINVGVARLAAKWFSMSVRVTLVMVIEVDPPVVTMFVHVTADGLVTSTFGTMVGETHCSGSRAAVV
jgi:hypothetical protein